MIEPLVSVIMPAYNAEKYIAESIQSVINQTHQNRELLIVDDDSSDNTKEIIQHFCKADKRIKYYHQQNGKPGKARNLALANAKGDYIAFLDADDVWVPEKLSIQLLQIEEKKADLVFCEAYMFSSTAGDISGLINSGKGYFKGHTGLNDFLEKNKILTSSVLVKSGIIKKVNGFTESALIPKAEDYHLWLKLLISNYIFFGSELVLTGYRIHNASESYMDRLAVVNTLEALQDLKTAYTPYKKTINHYHKKWFNRYHYSTNNWTDKTYRKLISKNCSYLNRAACNVFFQATYSFLGLDIARNLITKTINSNLF